MLIKEFYTDRLYTRIFDTREAMGQCAGEEIAQKLRELLASRDQVNIMFGAAPSQNETLATLVSAEGIDWSRVNAFHMDEYVGPPTEHPAGFGNYLNRHIFSLLPFRSVNLINGGASDIDAEAARYSELLEKMPLDICVLGIGENGHIAFNDPHVADFCDPLKVKLVELDERCRMQQVHDGCFECLDEVPRYALTATVPAMFAAGTMICSVPAKTKAEAVKRTIEGPISALCPASVMRLHVDARLYTDADAALLII